MRMQFNPTGGHSDQVSGQSFYGLFFRQTLKQSNINVLNTATPLPTTALSARKAIYILNNSADFIYLGASDVSTANGLLLLPKASIMFPLEEELTLYAISAGTSSDTRILECA